MTFTKIHIYYRLQYQNTYLLLRSFGWSKCEVSKLFAVDRKAFEKQLSFLLGNNENGMLSSLNQEKQQLLSQKKQSLVSLNKHPKLYDSEQISIQFFKIFIYVDNFKKLHH